VKGKPMVEDDRAFARLRREVQQLGSLVRQMSIQIQAVRNRVADLENFAYPHTHPARPAGKKKKKRVRDGGKKRIKKAAKAPQSS
jgi:hypothetical protein